MSSEELEVCPYLNHYFFSLVISTLIGCITSDYTLEKGKQYYDQDYQQAALWKQKAKEVLQ